MYGSDQLLAAVIKASMYMEAVRHKSGGCYMSYSGTEAMCVKVRNC